MRTIKACQDFLSQFKIGAKSMKQKCSIVTANITAKRDIL
jgi:hypothetical protein